MPAHQSYDVNSAEGGAPPPNAKWSTGAWILRLIVFFVLSTIILMLCLLWLGREDHSKMGDGAKLESGAFDSTTESYDESGKKFNDVVIESEGDAKTNASEKLIVSPDDDPNITKKPRPFVAKKIKPTTTTTTTTTTSTTTEINVPIVEVGSGAIPESGSKPTTSSTTKTFKNDNRGRKVESRTSFVDSEETDLVDQDGAYGHDRQSTTTHFSEENTNPLGNKDSGIFGSPGKKTTSTSQPIDKAYTSGVSNESTTSQPPKDQTPRLTEKDNSSLIGGSPKLDDAAEKTTSTSQPIDKAYTSGVSNESTTSQPPKDQTPRLTEKDNSSFIGGLTKLDDAAEKTTSTSQPIDKAYTTGVSNESTTSQPPKDQTPRLTEKDNSSFIGGSPKHDDAAEKTTSTSQPIDKAYTSGVSNESTTSQPPKDQTPRLTEKDNSSFIGGLTKLDDAAEKTSSTSQPIDKDYTSGVSSESTTSQPPQEVINSTLGKTTTWPTSTTNRDHRSNENYLAPPPPFDEKIINLGNEMASKMLYYMNHSADACEDFYEYACGRFETDESMVERNLENKAINRIFDQAKKSLNESSRSEQFIKYYDSCLVYNKNQNKSEKSKFLKNAVAKIGEFYPSNGTQLLKFDVTPIISKLLQHNSAPFFDVTVEVDVENQETCDTEVSKKPRFTLSVGPPVPKNIFDRISKEYDCEGEIKAKMPKREIDFGDVYRKYLKCKNNLPEFLDAVNVTLDICGLNEADMGYTRYGIEFDVLAAFSQKYPNQGEIRKAYLTKDYKRMTIAQLQEGIEQSFFNWTRLVENLFNSTFDIEQPIHVYFPDIIIQGLKQLFHDVYDKKTIKNGLLGLYGQEIYNELFVSPRDVENYCKRVATKLMSSKASELYMESFSNEEVDELTETMTNLFKNLRKTFENSVKVSPWLEHRDENGDILKKIRELTIEIPKKTRYNADNGNRKITKELLTGNFFEDTITLQKNNRKRMYEMLKKSTNDFEEIWSYFALPFETIPSPIYELNKIVVPYGAVDLPFIKNAKRISSSHLILATIGTKIGRLIAQHFDFTGVQHYADMRSRDPPGLLCKYNKYLVDEYKTVLDDYRLSDNPENIVLPSNNRRIQYTISDLSLNERFSEIAGLRMAYETMSQLPINSKQLLPWLNTQEIDERKQFFLAYAQMFCTKVPLTSSFVSLFEDENLPSRLRISVTASSTKILSDTWKCKLGSRVNPEYNPMQAFPYSDKLL